MMESKIYLKFFRENILIIFGLTCIGFLIVYFWSIKQPRIYTKSELLIMLYNKDNIQDRINLTDQAVSLIRTAQIQGQLKIDPSSKLLVYKMAPLAMTIDISNMDEGKASSDLLKIDNFSLSNFPMVKTSGSILTVKNSINPFIPIIASVCGFLIGVLISLLKYYFQYY